MVYCIWGSCRRRPLRQRRAASNFASLKPSVLDFSVRLLAHAEDWMPGIVHHVRWGRTARPSSREPPSEASRWIVPEHIADPLLAIPAEVREDPEAARICHRYSLPWEPDLHLKRTSNIGLDKLQILASGITLGQVEPGIRHEGNHYSESYHARKQAFMARSIVRKGTCQEALLGREPGARCSVFAKISHRISIRGCDVYGKSSAFFRADRPSTCAGHPYHIIW
jgi:hypothetical protein